MEALELVPLCEATLHVRETLRLEGTPSGSLMIGELRDSVWQGDRLRARQRGVAAADWLDVAPDGTARVHVRLTLETHDGALIYVEYGGRTDLTTGLAYTTPTFRTGDPRYAWLNRVQGVAKGLFRADVMQVHYPMIYEMR